MKFYLPKYPKRKNNPTMLKDLFQKYINIFDLQELTPSVLSDMVKHVDVHAPQTIDKKRTQEIDIVYDLVGILPLSLLNNEETV